MNSFTHVSEYETEGWYRLTIGYKRKMTEFTTCEFRIDILLLVISETATKYLRWTFGLQTIPTWRSRDDFTKDISFSVSISYQGLSSFLQNQPIDSQI